ncbi:hypothetical protein LB503_011654 [Fusarium chuoi]|nr:hypothetical protein LB503_011654 [Fusarium chuoi]
MKMRTLRQRQSQNSVFLPVAVAAYHTFYKRMTRPIRRNASRDYRPMMNANYGDAGMLQFHPEPGPATQNAAFPGPQEALFSSHSITLFALRH